ncbi:GerW family sporulation protein [Chloroflexota bacterium]
MTELIKSEEVKDLLKANLEEIEKVLTTKTVVGEPTIIGDTTLIPLISVGFFVGAGGGAGTDPKKGGGTGGIGTGGQAGIKPVGMVIIDKSGIRVESVKGGLASAVEKFAETLPEVVERWRVERKEKGK